MDLSIVFLNDFSTLLIATYHYVPKKKDMVYAGQLSSIGQLVVSLEGETRGFSTFIQPMPPHF